MRIACQQIARPAEPREKSHDRRGVEPRNMRAGRSAFLKATFGDAAPVMTEMKRQVPFDRQMDVDRPREKRKHAEREAHKETEEIKIRPGHKSPRAQTSQNLYDGRKLLFPAVAPGSFTGRSTSARRSKSPGVRKISPRSKSGVRESGVSAMVITARCNSGSVLNCSAPAKSHESIFASMARNSDCKPDV